MGIDEHHARLGLQTKNTWPAQGRAWGSTTNPDQRARCCPQNNYHCYRDAGGYRGTPRTSEAENKNYITATRTRVGIDQRHARLGLKIENISLPQRHAWGEHHALLELKLKNYIATTETRVGIDERRARLGRKKYIYCRHTDTRWDRQTPRTSRAENNFFIAAT